MLAAPLARCVAEWWIAVGRDPPIGTVLPPSLCEAYRVAVALCDQAPIWHATRHALVALAVYAARVVGWSFLSPVAVLLPPPHGELHVLQLAQPVLMRLFVSASLARTTEGTQTNVANLAWLGWTSP